MLQQPYVDEDFGTLYLAQPGEWDDGDDRHYYPVLLTQITDKLCYMRTPWQIGRDADDMEERLVFAQYTHTPC